MSPSGLQKFLDGSTPYAFTRRKLERWYVRESARYGGSLSVGSAAAALRVLLQELPAPRRVSAADALVRSLADRYRVAAGREPKWLTELRDLIERGDF